MNNDNNTEPVLYAVGARGYSAYECAVQEGFVGTEEEWLESLVGPQGETGPQGKSAYQVAVDNGYEGTEEEWVNSFLSSDGYYNKTEVDGLISGQLKGSDVINTLTSDITDKPLSAAQGKVLKDDLTTTNTNVSTNTLNISSEITNRTNADAALQQQIDALGSGSPLAASDISEMTDTTKTYVNTTDGNWYYYDGDSWEIGDVYQSTAIADKSITYDKLESEIQDSFVSTNVTTVDQVTKGGYIKTDGTYQAVSDTYGYYEIDVNPFETYILNIKYELSTMSTNRVRYMFKHDSSIISYTTGADVPTQVNDYYYEIVNIPYNVNKLVINTTGIGTTTNNYINKINKYLQNDIGISQLDNSLKAFFNEEYEDVAATIFIDNCYIAQNRTLHSYTSTKVYSLSVNPGEKYRITMKQNYSNPIFFYTNENNTNNVTFSDNTYAIKLMALQVKSDTSSYQFSNYEFTIPEYCHTIYINKTNSDSSFKIQKVTKYKVNVDDVDIPVNNPLKNKTLCFAGDSIMAATTTGVKGWVTLMSENNPDTNFYNYGHDGYTIAKAEDSWSSRSIQNVLSTILSEHSDTDYIVIQGGVNDYYGSSHGITLGDITSGYNPDNFDRTTFSDGLQYIFNYIYQNFPGTKLVYIVTHQCYISGLYQFMDRAREVCKKWSVPFIDLWNEGNINLNISYMRNNYSIHTESSPSGDGLHPNLDGYKITEPLIENSLKYKI